MLLVVNAKETRRDDVSLFFVLFLHISIIIIIFAAIKVI